MTPAWQLIDALVKLRGDTLVINHEEPPYICRGHQKGYLMKRIMPGEIIRELDVQLQETFANSETINYSGREIGHWYDNEAIHLKLI